MWKRRFCWRIVKAALNKSPKKWFVLHKHRPLVSKTRYDRSKVPSCLQGKGWEAGFNPAVDATIAGAVTLRGFLPSFKVTKPSKPGLQIKGREVKLITTNYRGDIGAEKHAWEITLNHQGSGPSGEAIPHQASKKFFDKATKCLRAPTLGPTVSEYSNRFLGTWNFNDISVVEVSIDVQIKRYFRLVRVNEKNKLEEPEWVPVYRKSIRVKCEETSNP